MKYNVLIVDDEMLIREEIKSKIIRIAHPKIDTIELAEDGQAAKEIILKSKPDIVISDIRMPRMDGLSLIRECLNLKIQSKFLVLSGHDDYDYVREAFKYGVIDYLLKPIRISELELQLTSIIQQNMKENHSSSKTMIGIVKDYIEERAFSEVTMTEVSNLLSMNYTYFSGWFKEETGLTFTSYLMKLRMEKAKKLLEDPTILVSEVAVKVGYDNIYHFSRAFKNYTGSSPKSFRKGNTDST